MILRGNRLNYATHTRRRLVSCATSKRLSIRALYSLLKQNTRSTLLKQNTSIDVSKWKMSYYDCDWGRSIGLSQCSRAHANNTSNFSAYSLGIGNSYSHVPECIVTKTLTHFCQKTFGHHLLPILTTTVKVSSWRFRQVFDHKQNVTSIVKFVNITLHPECSDKPRSSIPSPNRI